MPGGLARILTRRNLLLGLAAAWLVLTVAVAAAPYAPMGDLYDATTNYIWTREYARGVFHIPYDEWAYPVTQSSVVWYEGGYVVVNEKGPGHALLIVPFYLLGAESLFAPLLAGLAALSTYLLGKRLLGWMAGFVAAAAVLVNLNVIVMWHRYYWTDAATMHLLVASAAFLVEALFRANGGSLDPRSTTTPSRRDTVLALSLSLLGGLALGGSIATRYPVALVVLAFASYLATFAAVRGWPALRRRDLRAALRSLRPLALVLPFALGLLLVLVPLMDYNTRYFGGPFASGYDATSLTRFNPAAGLAPRNSTEGWFSSPMEGVGNALWNVVALAPVLVLRMPLLLLAPLAFWPLRRNLALALLVPWILIALYTYLSMDWIVQYARPNLVPWEPRYFMPALPPIAIFGGWVVDRLARGKRLFRALGVSRTVGKSLAVAALLLLPVLLFGLVPGAAYLANPAAGARPPGPGPGPMPRLVTTDELAADPGAFDGMFVRLENASVIQLTPQGARVLSPGDSASVEVQLVDWPAGQRPTLSPGTIVDVQGPFHWGPPRPGGIRPLFIGVRWGTADYLRVP
ncbi:MAG: hypothetical protein A3K68_06810 [Euryarchaeota archaeon RBG_16_68_13]|nr:MAG: hypothetical protein A3K68_06810 [Euryarchaeota archaeon RBG_16_68_13]